MTPADYKALVQRAIDQGLMTPTKSLYDEYGYRIAQPITLPREQYYTTAEAAALLGVRPRSIENLFKSKDITPYTAPDNNIRLWLFSDIQAIRALRPQPGPPQDPDFIPAAEAAKIVGVEPKTLADRAKKQNLDKTIRLITHPNKCKVATAFYRKSQLKLITK